MNNSNHWKEIKESISDYKLLKGSLDLTTLNENNIYDSIVELLNNNKFDKFKRIIDERHNLLWTSIDQDFDIFLDISSRTDEKSFRHFLSNIPKTFTFDSLKLGYLESILEDIPHGVEKTKILFEHHIYPIEKTLEEIFDENSNFYVGYNQDNLLHKWLIEEALINYPDFLNQVKNQYNLEKLCKDAILYYFKDDFKNIGYEEFLYSKFNTFNKYKDKLPDIYKIIKNNIDVLGVLLNLQIILKCLLKPTFFQSYILQPKI